MLILKVVVVLLFMMTFLYKIDLCEIFLNVRCVVMKTTVFYRCIVCTSTYFY